MTTSHTYQHFQNPQSSEDPDVLSCSAPSLARSLIKITQFNLPSVGTEVYASGPSDDQTRNLENTRVRESRSVFPASLYLKQLTDAISWPSCSMTWNGDPPEAE